MSWNRINSCRSIRRKLRTARTLSPQDWWVLLQAWLLLLAVGLGLRVLPFRRVQEVMAGGWRQPEALEPTAELAAVQHLQRLVDIAGRNHFSPMRCLQRSLVLHWLLRRRGIAADLRIGVRKEAGELSAHAWLEHAGAPIGEPETIAVRFAPLVVAGVSSQAEMSAAAPLYSSRDGVRARELANLSDASDLASRRQGSTRQ